MGKKSKYIIAIILILLTIIIVAINSGDQNLKNLLFVFKKPVSPELEFTRSFHDILSTEEMRADLDQFKRDIEQVHPKTKGGLSDEMLLAFENAYIDIQKSMTVSGFAVITSEIACLLEDAHTLVRAEYIGDLSLPIEVKVVDSKFYALNGKKLQPKDILLSFGDVPIEEIYEMISKRFPAENIFWRNLNFGELITKKSTLVQMGVDINDKVIDISVDRDGEILHIPMRFGDVHFKPIKSNANTREYKTYPEEDIYNPQFLYHIDREENLCHFILKSCNNTPEDAQFLENMFKDIKKYSIERMAIDLRGNCGGNSMVVNEFLKYIDIYRYKTFGNTRRLSEQSAAQRGFFRTSGEIVNKPRIRKNKRIEELTYGGCMYTLVDNGTFSSGNLFAAIIADNDLGLLIGEPTGNAPNTCGDILLFQMNNSKLMYNISYTEWTRPNKGRKDDYTLYPDVYVKYEIDDYVHNKDLVYQKLLEIIKENKCK